MQRLEVSGVVRLIYGSLGVKGLIIKKMAKFVSSSFLNNTAFNRASLHKTSMFDGAIKA